MTVQNQSPRPQPITDTHVHFWDTGRAIPWPDPEFTKLHRNVFPKHYQALARPLGITGAGVVEASHKFDDQLWVLDQIRGDDFFKFYVAALEIGADDFLKKLDRLAADPLVVGVRAFLWGPELSVTPGQVAHCAALAQLGMTMDIISRGDFNPKDKVAQLARAVPGLRVIVDHLAGAKGAHPDPRWCQDVRLLAENENVHVKFSSFFDMFNPADDERLSWDAPPCLESYKAHFDVLSDAFGTERMIWGSNWPVVEMGGTLREQIQLAEEYLQPLGEHVRNKVMSQNAMDFYVRHT